MLYINLLRCTFDLISWCRHATFETTAAEALANAPDRVEAMHVSETAEKTQDAANQAAAVAKVQ